MNKVHIALNSFNFQESITFYSKMFDTKPEKLTDNYAKFTSPQIPINLTLNRSESPIEGGQINHLGVEVSNPDLVQSAIERFTREDIDQKVQLDTDCCYARQDKVWVSDPDNNAWEFFYVKEQLLDKLESGESNCSLGAVGCC